MCIVTYFPTQEGFFLTTNRDEKNTRQTAYPKAYKHQQHNLIYPKDCEKGGSWVAIHTTHKKMACLLNAKGDQPNHHEKISRGKIPISLLLDEKTLSKRELLKKVSPFTLIYIQYFDEIRVQEYNWDGKNLNIALVDEKKSHLWASNTLYSADEKSRLTKRFEKNVEKFISPNDVVDFHNKNAQPLHNPIFLKKDRQLQTLSITSLQVTKKDEIISYTDLLKKSTREIKILINKPLQKVLDA